MAGGTWAIVTAWRGVSAEAASRLDPIQSRIGRRDVVSAPAPLKCPHCGFRYVSAAERRRERLAAEGKCIDCAGPKEGVTYRRCQACRLKQAAVAYTRTRK